MTCCWVWLQRNTWLLIWLQSAVITQKMSVMFADADAGRCLICPNLFALSVRLFAFVHFAVHKNERVSTRGVQLLHLTVSHQIIWRSRLLNVTIICPGVTSSKQSNVWTLALPERLTSILMKCSIKTSKHSSMSAPVCHGMFYLIQKKERKKKATYCHLNVTLC